MKYRNFGKTGIRVSALGFGTMRLPLVGKDEADKRVDEQEAIAIIRRGIGKGINYVDTAYGYHGGHSERIVGLALQDGWREKTCLATKFPCWEWKKPGDFERILDVQLGRLQTDCVDFYLFHAVNADSWHNIILKQGLLDKMVEAKEAGKIRHIGFSFHDNLEVFKSIIDATDIWEFCQIQLNYLDTENQAGVAGLRYAHAKGLGVIAMTPLKGGKLVDLPPEAAKVFEGTGRTAAEWGLSFLWNMPELSMMLSGMGSRQMVDDNIEYASRSAPGMLTPEDAYIIAQARQALQGTDPIPCTSCEYCLPCPQGVAIPSNFRAFNNLSKDKTKAECKALYETWVPMFGKQADACVGCRVCESLCPQQIPIADRMKDVAETFRNLQVETDEDDPSQDEAT
ncbi:MAG: aldo/keto reductase [Kiritimatiellia bacterium]|jgi:predicted aldo/keto reductase-like oxidoreductase